MAFHPDQNLEGHPHKWGTMLAVSLSIFMATIDLSIVNVSLPTLVEQLNTDFATIQWVILSYVLMVTALMLSVARLGDIWGMKKIYITGQLVFTISSILCGLSPGVNWLIGFRALQGVGAVMTQSVGIGIVTAAFPASERGRAMGIVGGVVSVGLALGPALGGILIGLVGWRSVFLVNAPIGAAAITATLRYVTPTIHGRPGQKFDLAGAVVLFLTLTTYALGMTLGQRRGFGDLLVLFLLTSAAIGLVLFVLAEKYSAQPMVDPALFKNVLFTINLLMGFVVFLILAGSIVMPFFLECVKGWPTEKVGLMMMVVPVTMGLVAPVAGSMSDRYGSRVISLVGLLVVIGGCMSMSTLNENLGALGIAARIFPMGIGMGLFQSPNNSAIMGAVPRERLGIASGLMALTRTLGQTSGLPMMGAVFTAIVVSASGGQVSRGSVIEAPAQALVAGIRGTYLVAASVCLLSVLLAALALWKDRRIKKAAEQT